MDGIGVFVIAARSDDQQRQRGRDQGDAVDRIRRPRAPGIHERQTTGCFAGIPAAGTPVTNGLRPLASQARPACEVVYLAYERHLSHQFRHVGHIRYLELFAQRRALFGRRIANDERCRTESRSGRPGRAGAGQHALDPIEHTQYQNLISYDNQELLYASFLDPQDALANADSVFLPKPPALLGSPGHPETYASNDADRSGGDRLEFDLVVIERDEQSAVGCIDPRGEQAMTKRIETLAAYANAAGRCGVEVVDYQA